jgi:DNA modification methylase
MPGEWNGRLAPAHEFVFHFNNKTASANKWIKTKGESAKRGASGKRFRQKDGTLREITSPDKVGQPYKVPDSVIRIGREMARGIHTQVHPAVFSVEFAAFFLQTWSQEGDMVYEPFSGSGTMLVAAEQLNRICYMMEIDPIYCDVTVQRWENLTGQKAVKVSAG